MSAVLDHVSIRVGDMARATRFWDAIMAVLGVAKVWNEAEAVGYGTRNSAADDGHSYLTIRCSAAATRTDAPEQHWCFRAADRAAVDAFHAAGIAAGGVCNGPPGLRPNYHPHYYAAFLRDPDGNRLEAVCHRAG